MKLKSNCDCCNRLCGKKLNPINVRFINRQTPAVGRIHRCRYYYIYIYGRIAVALQRRSHLLWHNFSPENRVGIDVNTIRRQPRMRSRRTSTRGVARTAFHLVQGLYAAAVHSRRLGQLKNGSRSAERDDGGVTRED